MGVVAHSRNSFSYFSGSWIPTILSYNFMLLPTTPLPTPRPSPLARLKTIPTKYVTHIAFNIHYIKLCFYFIAGDLILEQIMLNWRLYVQCFQICLFWRWRQLEVELILNVYRTRWAWKIARASLPILIERMFSTKRFSELDKMLIDAIQSILVPIARSLPQEKIAIH